MIEGPEAGIHYIAASAGSYRNLLQELIFINPAVKATLQKNDISIAIPAGRALGAELILSGEGMRFFKESGSGDFNRFYP